MEHMKTNNLRFFYSILTEKEKNMLEEGSTNDALRFRRLNSLLKEFPGDEMIENIMSCLLSNIVANKTAYYEYLLWVASRRFDFFSKLVKKHQNFNFST